MLNGFNKLFNFSRLFAQKHLLSLQYPRYLRELVLTQEVCLPLLHPLLDLLARLAQFWLVEKAFVSIYQLI